MFKKFMISALVVAAAVTVFAGQNILKKTRWRPITNAKKSIVDMVGGEFHCINDGNSNEGVFYVEYCKKPLTGKKMIFSAESKAEGIPAGAKLAHPGNYAVFIDLAYQDGTRKFGIIKPFTYGNHDWEKVTAEFALPKPVSRINYHLLFRKAKGKVSFRNPVLTIE